MLPSPVEIRAQMRAQRNALTDAERERSAGRFATVLLRSMLLPGRSRIAAYVPFDGEIDPGPLLDRLRGMGMQIYLPAVHDNRLRFFPDDIATPYCSNRFGIPEPDVAPRKACPVIGLGLVLVPLVAVDSQGTRLGMGAGYYDRTFGFRSRRRHWQRPLLIGAAFEFQRIDKLTRNAWDVPLDGLATERGFVRFHNNGDVAR
jgi:5-formyltetrahydrofolate cyclo-ligase